MKYVLRVSGEYEGLIGASDDANARSKVQLIVEAVARALNTQPERIAIALGRILDDEETSEA